MQGLWLTLWHSVGVDVAINAFQASVCPLLSAPHTAYALAISCLHKHRMCKTKCVWSVIVTELHYFRSRVHCNF